MPGKTTPRHRPEAILFIGIQATGKTTFYARNFLNADRARYIRPALEKGFKVIGYYFRSRIEEVLRRNEQREGKERIPTPGILATRKRLELPAYDEMFEELYYVWIRDDGTFGIEEWVTPDE